MATDHITTRVNSARLPEYVGKTVRLACRVIQRNADMITVEAADGGEVNVQLFQVVGKAIDATTIKMMSLANLGSELDMKLVNDVIEVIHNPKLLTRMFN
ncbi:hypothetical protein C0991_008270 [Blastosporella zonata]|nr:hypothetical protein C0991_008270 [Blastosporella zonata]